jgi:hypothetical protein
LGGTLTTSANPVVGIAATSGGEGYWLVEADGNVLAFGSAHLHGTLPGDGVRVNDIVAIAPTGDGGGYWLIGRDGGEFALGDAKFHGSLPGVRVHVRDIVGMVATSDGGGYWIVGADGGVFAFGNANYVGSLPDIHVHVNDVRAMIPSSTRHGYVLVGSDGGAFVFGTGVAYYGSLPGRGVHVSDIVGLALTPDDHGYWMAGGNGSAYAFGNAISYAAPAGIGIHLPVVAIAAAPPSQFPNTTSANWVIQHTPVQGSGGELNAVRCTTSNDCTAVGYYVSGNEDRALVERWNGTSWSIQIPGSPGGAVLSELQGLSCPTSTECVAVGWYTTGITDVNLAEVWNGTKWSVETPPNPSGSGGAELTAVSCASSTACSAVGFYRNSGGTALTLAESWNGSSWSINSTPNPSGAALSQLLGVFCTGPGTCMAVGNYTTSSNTEVTLAESSSGYHWTSRATVVPSGARASSLSGVTCVGHSDCFAVGDYVPVNGFQTTLDEQWNGSRWAVIDTPGVSGAQQSVLEGVSCVSAPDCTTVGWYVNSQNISLTTAENWNGQGWAAEKTPNPSGALESHLGSVSCAATNFCTAVGDEVTAGGQAVPLAEQWVRHIGTGLQLSSSAPKAVTGEPIVLTAKVVATESGFGTPTGTVDFTVSGAGGSSVSCTGGDNVTISGGLARCNLPAGGLLASRSPYSVHASYGGAGDFKSSSTTLQPSESVAKDGTTVSVTSNANPSVYSQTITLTATVKPDAPGAGVPTGKVLFSIDGTRICPESTNALPHGGGATFKCTVPFFPAVGTHHVIATYEGDTNFLGSNNANSPATQTVKKDGTKVTVTSSQNPTTYTESFITVSATVKADAPGSGVPTGSVTFTINGSDAQCGDGQGSTFTLSDGKASCFVESYLDSGSYALGASYSGDSNFLPSNNANSPLTETVKPDPTTSALSHVIAGIETRLSPHAVADTELEAVVTANSPGNANQFPQGNVTFTETYQAKAVTLTCIGTGSDSVAIAFNSTNDRYEADCLVPTPEAVGTYVFTAAYPGTSQGYGASSADTTITVAAR